MNANKPLARIQPDTIIARYLAGETIPAIAQELGVTHGALYMWLWRTCPAEWVEAKSVRAERQYDTALDVLESGVTVSADGEVKVADGLTVSRMREAARFRFGELAVLRRNTFGANPQVQITVTSAGDVTSRIAELERELGLRTVEHDAQAIESKG